MADTTIPNPPETPAELAALATQLVQDLRSVRDRIPQFTLPHQSQPRLSGRAATVPLAAVEAGFAACDNQEALQKSIDVASVQFDHQYTGIFAELRDDANKLAAGLDHTLRSKRYRVGQAMLRVFNIARTLAKAPENAHLRVHIAAMDRALNPRRRNGNKPPEPGSVPPGEAPPSKAAV
jgi:hypothetical protein